MTLSSDVINFSLTDLGKPVTRVVEITNHRDAQTRYQFKLDCAGSVFKFDQTSGLLKAGEMKKVVIIFCPSHAINYYRKISCVIENQVICYFNLFIVIWSCLPKNR